jgi:hypothetical protein
MKTLLSVQTLLLAVSLQAQVQTPVFSSVPNGLSASPVNSGLPGFNNTFGPLFTNQPSSLLSGGNLNAALLNLQAALANAWPLVASFNNNFDFTTISASPGTTSTASTGTSTGTSAIPSTLLGGNVSTGLSTSLGLDLSTIAGGGGSALSPGGTVLGPPANLSPTGVTNSFGLQPSFDTNALAFTSQRDVLRAMLLLQDDIERALPLVNGLNGGSLATLPVAVPTNTVPTASSPNTGMAFPTIPQPRRLTPTGR